MWFLRVTVAVFFLIAILSEHYIRRALFSNCTIIEEYKQAMRNGMTVGSNRVVSVLTEMNVCDCECVSACVCV